MINRLRIMSMCLVLWTVSACGVSCNRFIDEKKVESSGAHIEEGSTECNIHYEERNFNNDDNITNFENSSLKYTVNNEEYILQIAGYEDTFVPFTILPELGDVTGDGKADLIVNIRINGNNLCETLSDTYVYTWKKGGLEEVLYIGCDEISVWDERYMYNLGSSISESGKLVVDVCGSKENGVIDNTRTIYLKYIEGEWKKQ